MKGITSFRKFLVLGLAAAAPVVGVGCSNTNCTTTVAPCATPSPCAAPVTYRVAKAPRAVARPVAVDAPVVYQAAPVAVNAGAPVVYAANATSPVVYADASNVVYADAANTVYADAGSSVTYKPIPSRNLAAALSNVDGADLGVIRSGSAGSAVISSVITAADLAAASNASYPAATASYPVAGVTYPTAGVSYPAGYVVSQEPAAAYSVPVDAGVNRQYRQRRGQPRGYRGAQIVTAPAGAAIPSGTPVYITPGGTPVSAYVPAPASGTYLEGAAPTGYLPVTERRGPNNAVIHYATRSICEYDPARGEDCVWTSGF